MKTAAGVNDWSGDVQLRNRLVAKAFAVALVPLILGACAGGSEPKAHIQPTATETSSACSGSTCASDPDSTELKGHQSLHLGIAQTRVNRGQAGTPQDGTPHPTPEPVEAFVSNAGDASA